MGGVRRNLELKARDADSERSLATCESLGAEDRGSLLQEDTYFNVPRGRLKLRRQHGTAAHLIAYQRPDVPGQKESRYRIIEVSDASELEAALADALGVAAVIKKTRRFFAFEGVRIHLDRVEDLGSFIELEGVATADDELERFPALLEDLRQAFGIEDVDLLEGSYCDLALAARP